MEFGQSAVQGAGNRDAGRTLFVGNDERLAVDGGSLLKTALHKGLRPLVEEGKQRRV